MTDRAPALNKPGTYALVLACQKTGRVRIGRLGVLALQPGFYVYVGSAFGSGGLAARLPFGSLIKPSCTERRMDAQDFLAWSVGTESMSIPG